MGKQVIIFGVAQMAEQIKILFDYESERVVAGFTVDDEYFEKDQFCGLPVVPFSKLQEVYSPDEYGVLISIGMRKMNGERERIYTQLKKMGYSVEGFISKKASIYTKDIGEGNIFLPNCVIAPKVKIGNANFFDVGTAICHHSQVGNYNFFAVAASTAGDVTVGDSCFVASNSIIKPAVKVANHTLVGANAYIDKDTEEYGVYVPARSTKLVKK